MKIKYSKLLIIFLMICLTGNACYGKKDAKEKEAKETKEIKWIFNLSDGLKLAKKENKPVMVDFYADWCGWCKRLDKTSYSDLGLIKFSTNFINVKVNTDKNPKESRNYGIRGLPTIIFLKPDGKIIQKIVGYRDAKYFLKITKEIIKNRK